MRIEFEEIDGVDFVLTYLGPPKNATSPDGSNLIAENPGPLSLWSLQLVDPNTTFTITSNISTHLMWSEAFDNGRALLHWDMIPASLTTINVTLAINLPPGASSASWRLSFTNNDPSQQVGLWQYTLLIPSLIASANQSLFVPSGYGVVHPNPSAMMNSFALPYPSSTGTMQFFAYGGSEPGQLGIYIATHDANAHTKSLVFRNNPTSPCSDARDNSFEGASESDDWFPQPQYNASIGLGFSLLVENAGHYWTEYEQPFDFVLALTSSTPLWFAAAQLYREWALAHAPWTSAGLVTQRADIPQWLLENHLWINTGWQCHDVLNVTEGSPKVVLERALTMR
jgi:hypothetical protein